MSHQNATCRTLSLIVAPATSGVGRYEARLDSDDRLLCISRTPFFDGARELIADGYDPDQTLILRRAGSDMDGLRAKLGTAASLTVEETDYGPKLRRWKPFSALAVEPSIASDDRTAITPASHPTKRQPDGETPGGQENFETTP